MKNLIGTPARQEDFFKRDAEIEKIRSKLDAGNNLQIVAPRRVGKTSILFYLLDNAIGENVYVYVDTERIDNEQEFYKKLLRQIIQEESIAQSQHLKSLFKRGLKFFRKIKSLKVMGHGIDFHDKDEPDYFEEITNFLSGFELEEERKLVLLIDEYPQTILNIIESNKGETRQAIQFLQSNRELRLNPNIAQKIKFIYTGSIGLNHTVASINASAFVNDLNSIEIEPLTPDEAKIFIRVLLAAQSIIIEDEVMNHLLQKVDWLIPFHIQLAVQEITLVYRLYKIIGIKEINIAFENMVSNRNNNHFQHYYSRLKSQFKNQSFHYVEDILASLATAGIITTAELYNKAVGFGVESEYRQTLEILVYDGYINNTGDNQIYRFNSPVLRLWWQKFICK